MSSYQSVKNAISDRIAHSPHGLVLLTTYGIIAVTEEIDNYASGFDSYDLEEIGSSDISCWVRDIEHTLERHHKPINIEAPAGAESDDKEIEYLFRAKE